MPIDSYPQLKIWSAPVEPTDAAPSGISRTAELGSAEQLACQEMWRPPSAWKRTDLEPFSQAWFEWLEHRRYARQGSWLAQRMEFRRHSGDKILCLGHGLGTDWVQYAAHAAEVTVLHPSLEQLGLVRRNFEARRLTAHWVQGTFTALPQRDNSMDIVCLSGLHGPLKSLPDIIGEIYRVLRPGGKVLTILPAYYNVARWQKLCLPWLHRFLRKPPSKFDESCFSARELQRIFHDFSEHRIYKRHLRRSDLPHIWRWLPLPLLERLMGKFLLLKAFKPLRSALAVAAAA